MSQPESRYGVLPSMMSWAETAAESDGSDAATLDSCIRALYAYVPATGSKNATADELAEALNVPAADRGKLRDAFRSAVVHAGDSRLPPTPR